MEDTHRRRGTLAGGAQPSASKNLLSAKPPAAAPARGAGTRRQWGSAGCSAGSRGWLGGPEKDAADSNPQSVPRLAPLSGRAAANASRACEEEAKLRPPPSPARKLQVSGCLDPSTLPRARPVPPEVPDWRAAGAGSSSAAFRSSLGTPPSVGVASAEGGRREHAGPGHSSTRGARRCRAAGCKLCAALQELRDSGALQPHRTTPPGCCRRFQSSTRKAAPGTLLPLSRPPPPPLAERRSAEGRGLLHTDAHLPAPCTPEQRCRAEVRLPK